MTAMPQPTTSPFAGEQATLRAIGEALAAYEPPDGGSFRLTSVEAMLGVGRVTEKAPSGQEREWAIQVWGTR